jgi:hypothetical protein
MRMLKAMEESFIKYKLRLIILCDVEYTVCYLGAIFKG